MNKTGKKKRCIHCLKFTEWTDDHILPRSYYQDSVSNEIKNLWVAPACQKCNNDLGRAEVELLTLLGLCLKSKPDSNLQNEGVKNKVLRSLNPNATTDEREKRIRKALAKKFLKRIFPTNGSLEGVFPNFGYHDGWDPEKQHGILIPADLPEKIGRKLIKGIEFKLDGRYIDNSYDLEIQFCYENDIQNEINLIHKYGQKIEVAPGFEFYRVTKEKIFLYEIRIWDQLIIYGTLMKKKWWRFVFNPKYWQSIHKGV